MYQDDPATHFLGWHFFRNEPWHLPLGLNWAYGMEMSSSIVYTDSIPLLALIFKPFSNYLPTLFQYTGLWILICFALQGTFGWLKREGLPPITAEMAAELEKKQRAYEDMLLASGMVDELRAYPNRPHCPSVI